MNRHVHALRAVLLGVVSALCTSCVETAPSQQPAQPANDSLNYPQGLNPFKEYVNYTVRVRVAPQAGDDFTWPEVSKDLIAEMFIKRMNRADPATQFLLADGPSNFEIKLTVTQDSTRDHYGLEVKAWGLPPGSYHVGEDVVPHKTQHWFTIRIDNLYRNWDSAVDAAADKTAGYLVNGWTH